MKSLAASNRHLQPPASRKAAVERNVRSASAIEGVSAATFRSAADGRFVTKAKAASRSVVLNDPPPRKKK